MASRAMARKFAAAIIANGGGLNENITGLEGRTDGELVEIIKSHPSHILRILADKTLTKRKATR